MFHLTRYRYWFFAISLIVIIPGLLALAFWGLNLGIDFTQGTSITLRFQNGAVTTANVSSAFQQGHAQDVQVYAATQTGDVPASQYAYIHFSRPIGKAEETTVIQRLQDPKYKLPQLGSKNNPTQKSDHTDYTVGTGDNATALMVVHFADKVTPDAIQAALKDLPPTDAPSGTTPATGTTTPAATATTAPTATAAAGATATPSTSGQTFPVSVTKVELGANPQVYQVNTQTDLVNVPQAVKADTPTLDKIVEALRAQYGPVYVVEKSVVGPAVATETTISAILAVALASVAILLYIAIAFRKVGKRGLSFRFGASAIIALLHDALVVLGLWAIFGHFFNFKVDTLFLTAVLTVIGFSVHDTIVVFDRIRENLSRRTSESFETVVDTSLIQTMSRSLNTSLTVLLVLSAETLFGGASTREFVLALLIGIASGTYSSIFNASMILTVWQTGEYRRWFRRTPPDATRRPAPARAVARV
ncbi:MAG: protein translocase subunit SecF [Ktedonobacterales bacterium]